MNKKKVALSLAVCSALYAPFFSETWYEPTTLKKEIQLTSEEKAKYKEYLSSTSNCESLRKENDILVNYEFLICQSLGGELIKGTKTIYEDQTTKYWIENIGVALIYAVFVFFVSLILPVAVKYYWNWVRT